MIVDLVLFVLGNAIACVCWCCVAVVLVPCFVYVCGVACLVFAV